MPFFKATSVACMPTPPVAPKIATLFIFSDYVTNDTQSTKPPSHTPIATDWHNRIEIIERFDCSELLNNLNVRKKKSYEIIPFVLYTL
jgi:hypothetical protein